MVARTSRGTRRDGRGSVTAETALVLPAVLLFLGLVLATGRAVAVQLDCIDASRYAARLAARGEPESEVVASARSLVPARSEIVIRTLGDRIRVTVMTNIALPLPWHPHLTVRAASTSHLEEAFINDTERGQAP